MPSETGIVHVIDEDEALRDSLTFLLRAAGHGGTIAPRPNPEGGTVFSFTLSAVTEEEAGNAV